MVNELLLIEVLYKVHVLFNIFCPCLDAAFDVGKLSMVHFQDLRLDSFNGVLLPDSRLDIGRINMLLSCFLLQARCTALHLA